MILNSGGDLKYDLITYRINKLDKEISKYIEEQKMKFSCQVVYVANENKQFHLQFPEETKVGVGYTLERRESGFCFYSTQETKEFVTSGLRIRQDKEDVLNGVLLRLFETITNNDGKWKAFRSIEIINEVLEMRKDQMELYRHPKRTIPDNLKGKMEYSPELHAALWKENWKTVIAEYCSLEGKRMVHYTSNDDEKRIKIVYLLIDPRKMATNPQDNVCYYSGV